MVKIVGCVHILLLVAMMPLDAASQKMYDATNKFTGEGTYYGVPPVGSGHCALRSPLPNMYDGMIPVAINNDQYEGSKSCGACIKGKHEGKTEFMAYVMDECPECGHGDLDFGVDGRSSPYSDGRWEVEWQFVPCPGASENPSFVFEGSNDWYWKLQPRGLSSPVTRLWVDGQKATRTVDNFFVIQGNFAKSETVKVKTAEGKVIKNLTVERS